MDQEEIEETATDIFSVHKVKRASHNPYSLQNSSQIATDSPTPCNNDANNRFSNDQSSEEEKREQKEEADNDQATCTPIHSNQNQLLKLLSNLEGLTPAGLEHLLSTQDRVEENNDIG